MLAFVDQALVSRRGIAGQMDYDQGRANRQILSTRGVCRISNLLHHCRWKPDIAARMLHSLLKLSVSMFSRKGKAFGRNKKLAMLK
jgi:hypothetical protein